MNPIKRHSGKEKKGKNEPSTLPEHAAQSQNLSESPDSERDHLHGLNRYYRRYLPFTGQLYC